MSRNPKSGGAPLVITMLRIAGVITFLLGAIEIVDAYRNTDQFWPFALAIFGMLFSAVFFGLARVVEYLWQS